MGASLGRTSRIAALLLGLLGLGQLTGCKSPDPTPPPPPPRTNVILRFKPAPDMNPNDRGEATPLDVRIYQLKDKTAFSEAAFEELWTDATNRLSTSLVAEPKVFNFEPAAADQPPQAFDFKLEPTTKFLGIMGLFSAERKEGLEERKVLVSVDEAGTKVIAFTGSAIKIQDPTK